MDAATIWSAVGAIGTLTAAFIAFLAYRAQQKSNSSRPPATPAVQEPVPGCAPAVDSPAKQQAVNPAPKTKNPPATLGPAFEKDLGLSPRDGEELIKFADNCHYAYHSWDYAHSCISIITNLRFIVRLNEDGERGIFRGVKVNMEKRTLQKSRFRINGDRELFIEQPSLGGIRITSNKETIAELYSLLRQLIAS